MFNGVVVQSVNVSIRNGPPNVFQTFWQQSDIDLSRGMDFSPRGSIFVRFTHLQHEPFIYNIVVQNQGPRRRGTCRIFLSPRTDEQNAPWAMREQRHFMIELDRFEVFRK